LEATAPEISLVVPSHDRPLRLRWLLNGLEEQTLSRERWEVVVGHDSVGAETEELLRSHPLARDGTLRHVTLPAGTAPPGRNRNAAWQAAHAPLVAFTDDDCRPPPEWLERALAAARAHPGSVVQGTTGPDPLDEAEYGSPWVKMQAIRPPTPYAEACNIVYPRELLERLGGFDETLYTGEDTDLAERARADGVHYVAAPEVLTYHAIEGMSLLRALRGALRWTDMPELVRRHPRLRSEFPLWIFWKRRHVWFPLAVAGILLERRSPLYALLALPWLIHATPKQHGPYPRGRVRALSELPGQFAIDAAEFGALAWGSARHRTFFV
jgi:glycosyltransferase involved in cell wall biosynthesis